MDCSIVPTPSSHRHHVMISDRNLKWTKEGWPPWHARSAKLLENACAQNVLIGL